jgi:hypothetical protein
MTHSANGQVGDCSNSSKCDLLVKALGVDKNHILLCLFELHIIVKFLLSMESIASLVDRQL